MGVNCSRWQRKGAQRQQPSVSVSLADAAYDATGRGSAEAGCSRSATGQVGDKNLIRCWMRVGAEIKVMETESYRRQKADEQPQQAFMDFSPEEAAAAREAAVREEAHRKAAAAGQTPLPAAAKSHVPEPAGAAQRPPAVPQAQPPREAALAAIEKIRHEIDDLAKQVRSCYDSKESGDALHTGLKQPC